MAVTLRPAIFLTLVVCVACGHHPLPEPLITDPSLMAQQLGASVDSTFLGEARIEFYGQGQARKGKATLMAAPEGRLRLDVFSFTDDLISLLILADGHFRYFERGQAACLGGPFCAAPMVARFPSLADPEKLARVLHGEIPLLSDASERSLRFSRKEGLYILRLVAGSLEQVVKVRPDGRTVVEALLKADEKLILAVDFTGRISQGDRSVPREIRIRAPGEDVDLSIRYREVEFGYPFANDPFALACPAGLETEFLICP
jgi:hypothetical protein